jgi:hypothetical protein
MLKIFDRAPEAGFVADRKNFGTSSSPDEAPDQLAAREFSFADQPGKFVI